MESMKVVAVPGLCALLIVLLGGCSSLNPGTSQAADTAREFHSLLAAGKGEQACDLLIPTAIEALEEGEPGSCAAKLAELKLGKASSIVDSRAFGRNAQVELDGDTVFLTVSGGVWRVMAAGCTPRGERPYDCEVEGN